MINNTVLYEKELQRVCDEAQVKWSELSGKKILITGASGMIGSYLVDLMMTYNQTSDDKIQIFALSRRKSRLEERFGKYKHSDYLHLKEQDVCLPIESDEAFDFIIHAASNTHPKEYSGKPVDTITANVFGLYNILEYAKNMKNAG